MKNNSSNPNKTSNPITSEPDAVVTAVGVGAVAAMYATSTYDADSTGVSRDFQLGGIQNGESLDVSGGALTTSNYAGVDAGFFNSQQTETQSIGLDGSTSHQETADLGCCGLFSSSQEKHESTGADGTTSGQSSEVTCFGMRTTTSEETRCCASDNCCAYTCSIDCCGEDLSLDLSTTCCCAPLINCCKNLPSLDDCGNCIAPVSDACQSLVEALPSGEQMAAGLGVAVGFALSLIPSE
jgi:hypothetical protein